MKIAVLGGSENMFSNDQAKIVYLNNISALNQHADSDAVIDLRDNVDASAYTNMKMPVFINSVVNTLADLNASSNLIRINAWPGFFENELLEVAGDMNADAAYALKSIGKKFVSVPDEPGFVSPRVISMIINEAFFAKGDNVSSEEDIDTAMKLGTNYPYGPFEWCRKIGSNNIYALLKRLSESDAKYAPSPALEKEINKN